MSPVLTTFSSLSARGYGLLLPSGPPPIVGQVVFSSPSNSPGTTTTGTWTVPTGVTSICVVCVGAGGINNTNGGPGGALSYTNNITVTPGESLTYSIVNPTVSSATQPRCALLRSATVLISAYGGADGGFNSAGGAAASGVGGTKYSGGNGGLDSGGGEGGGGGGAAGYAGNGGNGGGSFASGSAGNGGGGGGGGGGDGSAAPGVGGGVGLLGQGSNGSGGAINTNGTAGSGGSGTQYGGGGAIGYGAIRIIWGSGRSYPSTNTGNM